MITFMNVIAKDIACRFVFIVAEILMGSFIAILPPLFHLFPINTIYIILKRKLVAFKLLEKQSQRHCELSAFIFSSKFISMF